MGAGRRVRPGLGDPDDRIAGAKYVWGKGWRSSQTKLAMTITMMAIWVGGGGEEGVWEEENEGEDRIGYVYVCSTLGYWVCVWEGCLGSKGMGKHGEKEFDTIDLDFLVFWYGAKFGGTVCVGVGGDFLISVFGIEKLILSLADY